MTNYKLRITNSLRSAARRLAAQRLAAHRNATQRNDFLGAGVVPAPFGQSPLRREDD